MESIDYWRMRDELNIIQATLLILNVDPVHLEFEVESVYEKRPKDYQAVRDALATACVSDKLKSSKRHYTKYYSKPHYNFYTFLDLSKTKLKVDDLKEWMQKNGMPSKFFFPANEKPINEKPINEFLNPNNPNYAPKLASAVKAWIAVSENPELARGKTIKIALIKWLTDNAQSLGLTRNGKPSKGTIEEIATIANWDTKGGAPKTPEEPKK
jgi:arsenate reductase-like glutaredoxin family protein